MIGVANYEVRLYLNGALIGDCRELAQGLKWTRRRTKIGADSIDFTINDVLFNKWCEDRYVTINDLLKPLALECRVVRNGVALVGGFLATMPSYSPLQRSADLDMHFDGFLNLLDGVYIRNTSTTLPLGTITGKADQLIVNMITLANTISTAGGKNYGFVANHRDSMANITHTFDNYKTVKSWICDRCDNASGAGKFDVYFHADKKYDIYKEANFGEIIQDWVAFFPASLNNASATSISAGEVSGFASACLGVGSGEISSNQNENTAVIQYTRNNNAVKKYGYFESLYQESSVSSASVLRDNMNAELNVNANPIWQPEITLHGKQIAPKPDGEKKIWIGDIIKIVNTLDLTGMTNGNFRVNELAVDVSAAGDETITPTLERL